MRKKLFRPRRFPKIAATLASVAFVLLGAGAGAMGDHPEVARFLFVTFGAFGLLAVAAFALEKNHFEKTGKQLAGQLKRGRSFLEVSSIVADEWLADVDAWITETEKIIEDELSHADAELFRNTVTETPVVYNIIPSDPNETLNKKWPELKRHVKNLHEILSRYQGSEY